MDALTRIEPAARSLMRDVDAVLAAHGAPAEHAIWPLLRRLRLTPADAIAFFAELNPASLRRAADALRAQAQAYAVIPIPSGRSWRGGAGQAYAERARALAEHLGADPGGGDPALSAPGGLSLAGQLTATAAAVAELATWQERSRDRLARTLADVLSSTQAVALRACPALADGLAQLVLGRRGTAAASLAIAAAADVGAEVLACASLAHEEALRLAHGWSELTHELPLIGGVGLSPVEVDTAIDLRH